MEKKIKMNLKEDVDASEIARIVQVANQFSGTVYIEVAHVGRINAKSIMGMMSLLSSNGREVTVQVEGADAGEAVKAMEAIEAGLQGKG